MPEEPHSGTKLQSLFNSRRFWVAISGLAVVFAKHWNVDIPDDTIKEVVLIAGAWIVGDSLRRTE